jgi:hypothetical protein
LAQLGQTPKRPHLVRTHKTGIADNVSGKDGGQPAFQVISPSTWRLTTKVWRIHAVGMAVEWRLLAINCLTERGNRTTVSRSDSGRSHQQTHRNIEMMWLTGRNVLVVSFDDTGYVTSKQIFSLEDGREIEPIARITPTEGRDFTIMQQLLGNFGRLPGSATHDIPSQ